MKTAISIPDPLFRSVERLARRLGISRSQLFQRAVAEYVGTRRDEGITEALDTVYSAVDEASVLDPMLVALQSASLVREDWK